MPVSITTSGIVASENTVVAATILTDSSTSLLNFVANIVVVAAVGADVAITQAMVIMGVTRHNDITTAVIIGKAIRRTAATTVFSLATMPLVVMLTGMMSGFSS